MALGTVLGSAGRAREAADAFRQVLRLQPGNASALVNLGGALRRTGQHEAAVEAYRQALAAQPRLAAAHFGLGITLAAQGHLEQAEAAFRSASTLQPDHLPTLNNLADAVLRQGRADEALEGFEAIRRRDPAFPRIDYQLGTALQAMGRHSEAAAAFGRALAKDGNDLDALNNLCIALLRGGDPAAALSASEEYLRQSPANRKPLAYKAAALVELGRRDEAAQLLDFERLLLQHRPVPAAGGMTPAEFRARLAERLRSHPDLRFEPAGKSTVGGHQTGELLEPADPLMARLGEVIRGGVEAYMQHLRTHLPEHPYTASLPRTWKLGTWAVVLHSQGHQGPHFHPDGYISGVYYISLPADMGQAGREAGAIEFGRTDSEFGGTQPPMVATVTPEEGLMLLFPSYLYHRTLPFRSAESRISVAFDVLPAG
jgi:Flp pilus assembly protein TadD